METTKVSTSFKIGNELEVNRLGYGAMQLTGRGIFGDPIDRESAKKVLVSAVEQGVNFIDTAEAYGPQTNESLIADALFPYHKSDILIATKGGFERPGPDKWVINGDPKFISENIEGSLKRLKVKTIDLWQLHRVDTKVPLEDTLAPVVEAVKAGKIRHVGLSEVNVKQIERAEKVLPIVSVQNIYNLGNRQWEEVLNYTAQRGMAFIPWYPLASGPDKLQQKISKIANRYGATVAQIALAWLLRRSENILLIPGTKSIDHLKENIDSKRVELSDEDFEELSK
ncbi:MAG TPA: aldo/keto reductase [Chryseolinea sp.]|nr:aldo/keto reductase [Chryseolinea sp.]